MAKPDREVRKKTRDAALQLLAPRYLAAAENVGVAADRWLKLKREADDAAAVYQQAWTEAQQCGWSSDELSQLVEERPPRKAQTRTSAVNSVRAAADSDTATTSAAAPRETGDGGSSLSSPGR